MFHFLRFSVRVSLLELEIDEGLYVGGAHLNDNIDDSGQQQGVDHDTRTREDGYHATLPRVRKPMSDKCKSNKCKHEAERADDSPKIFYMEFKENIVKDDAPLADVGSTEHNPS